MMLIRSPVRVAARSIVPTVARRLFSAVGPTSQKRVLVTGAAGQIGTELVAYLEQYFGAGNVIPSDVKLPPGNPTAPFAYCDVLNFDMLSRVVLEQRITVIVHLASILSAIGEMNPQVCVSAQVEGRPLGCGHRVCQRPACPAVYGIC